MPSSPKWPVPKMSKLAHHGSARTALDEIKRLDRHLPDIYTIPKVRPPPHPVNPVPMSLPSSERSPLLNPNSRRSPSSYQKILALLEPGEREPSWLASY